MSNETAEIDQKMDLIVTDLMRVKEILEEALSGTSPKSKNSLIKDALKLL